MTRTVGEGRGSRAVLHVVHIIEPLGYDVTHECTNTRPRRPGPGSGLSAAGGSVRVVFVLWCVLDCFTQSRAFPQTTPPSLCILYTLYQNKHPSHLEHNLEAGSPLAGTSTKTPTPGQHRAVGHTRTHPYRIYRAPVRLWRGCSALSLSSCVSSLACQARERARALPSLSSSFCLAVSHPITGTRLVKRYILVSRSVD